MNKHISLYDCECHTHHLRVEFDTWDEVGSFYFSMLEGMSDVVPFWHRVRIALNMLFTGKEYHDSISLNKETAKELSDFIIEQNK